ncbi:MAG: ribonuclease E/G, partial [Candidatus Omnitrophica bacterium]|nr:ribonuclease E/G [Candidatus Omnitrophota bacterium]
PSGTEPKLIHKELDLFERVLRDNFSDDVEEIIIDHPRLKYRLAQFLKVIAPDTDIDRLVTFHTDRSKSVWQAFDLSKDLDRLFSKTIHLDCGGYIIIEEMETLTAIDINTGKNIAGKSLEETIFETNMEAAIEIPRQLRLRQIGGIIVCDFIDMRIRRNQDKVFKTLQEELSKDRTPSDIQEFTDLGLIQITRQRSGRSLTSQLTYECPHCHGRGRRPTFSFE